MERFATLDAVSDFFVKTRFLQICCGEIKLQFFLNFKNVGVTFHVAEQNFLCKIPSTSCHQQKAWTISPTQGCGDLDVDKQLTRIYPEFWIPSAFRKLLDKKDPAHVQEKKLCCVKASRVVLLYKVSSNFWLFQYAKKFNKYSSVIEGVRYFAPFFFRVILGQNLDFVCNFFD